MPTVEANLDHLKIRMSSLALQAANDQPDVAAALLDEAKAVIQGAQPKSASTLLPMLARHASTSVLADVIADDLVLAENLGADRLAKIQAGSMMTVGQFTNMLTDKFELDVFDNASLQAAYKAELDIPDRVAIKPAAALERQLAQHGIKSFYTLPELVVSHPLLNRPEDPALHAEFISALVSQVSFLAKGHGAVLSDYETIGTEFINLKFDLPLGNTHLVAEGLLMTIMDITPTLATGKRTLADQVFEGFDFQDVQIVARDGWQEDGNNLILVAYAEVEGQEDTSKISFHVDFDEKGYVIDSHAFWMDSGELVVRPARRGPSF
ncbi:hypothetical protein ACKF11_13125 [Methylobacillus sp. Pita2]|uniref:hypothetical protein n=1 Tax=Methylobacillus sp. Pita2 TaxID=3383245 RepID=UPI0038B53EEE